MILDLDGIKLIKTLKKKKTNIKNQEVIQELAKIQEVSLKII